MAPGTSWVAALGNDQTLSIWSSSDGGFLAKAPEDGAQAVAIIPGSHVAVLGDCQGNVRLIDVDTFEPRQRPVALDSPVSWLHATLDGRLFAATYDTLYRLDPATLAPTRLASLNTAAPLLFAASDDGTLIAVVQNRLGDTLNHLTVYSTADGKAQFAQDVPPRTLSIALSNQLVLVGTKDSASVFDTAGHILALDVRSSETIANIPRPKAAQALLLVPGSASKTYDILSSYLGGLERLQLETGQVLRSGPQTDILTSLAWGAGHVLAAGNGGVVHLCDPVTLQCNQPSVFRGNAIVRARSMEDGNLLLLDDQGDAISVGQVVSTGKLYPHVATVALTTHYQGKQGLFGIGANLQVNSIVSPATLPGIITIGSDQPVAVSSDGHYAAARQPSTTASTAAISVYDLSSLTSDSVFSPTQVAAWTLAAEGKFSVDAASEFKFAFTPDATQLIAVNTITSSIHRYDLQQREELPVIVIPPAPPRLDSIGEDFLSTWAISPDSRYIALGQNLKVRIVDLNSGAAADATSLPASVQQIAAAGPSLFYLALNDGIVLRWDGKSPPTPFAAFRFPLLSLLYLPGHNLLIASDDNGSIHFLDGATGKEEMELIVFPNGADWLVSAPNGLFDASDRGWRDLRWKFAANTFAASEPIEEFIDDFLYPGLAASVLAGDTPQAPYQLAAKERRTPEVKFASAAMPVGGKAALDLVVSAPAGVSIHDLHLSRNGVLLKTWSGQLGSGSHFRLSADVVAGDNAFTAYAFNQNNVKSTDAVVHLTGPQSLRRPGELYVVAIGIDNYKEPAFQLHYARQDAVLATQALAAQRADIASASASLAASANGTPQTPLAGTPDLLPAAGPAHITALLDQDATRARILDTVSTIARQARPEDTVLILFAGHGAAIGDRYYLIPEDFSFPGDIHDLTTKGADSLRRMAISDQNLRDALAGEQAAYSAIILDACQSGEVVGDKLAQRRGPMNSRGLEQLAYDKGMYILAASLSTQTAAEQDAIAHGVLSYALFEEGLIQDLASPNRMPSLSGEMVPGTSTLSDWLSWSANRVQQNNGQADGARSLFEPQANPDTIKQVIVQQPRLFSPPSSQSQLIVALHPIPEPATHTTMDTSAQTAAVTPPSTQPNAATPPSPKPELLYRPSTLGSIRDPHLMPGGHQLIGIMGGDILLLDLDHAAILWRQPVDPNLISMDVAPDGRIVCLNSSGDVFLVGSSATPASKRILQGHGYSSTALVRWLAPTTQLLVVSNGSAALITAQGDLLHSVALPGALAQAAAAIVLSPHKDRLFVADSLGNVSSVQLPSLALGPAYRVPVQNPPNFSVAPTQLVADPSAKLLLRLMSDGSVLPLKLPSLEFAQSLSFQPGPIATAQFSSDGTMLYALGKAGQVEILDTATGTLKRSWPATVAAPSQILVSEPDSTLVITGNGGVAAWDLTGANHRPVIYGGGFYLAACFAPAGLNLMLASRNQLSTFHLPNAKPTSQTPMTSFFISQSSIVGRSSSAIQLWNDLDPTRAKTIPLDGDGRLDLTPDRHTIAWIPNTINNPPIQILDAVSGKLLTTVQATGTVNSFALAPDGHSLAYLAGDQLSLAPILSSAQPASFSIPQAPCCLLRFAPIGNQLLFASDMGDVLLYDPAYKRVVRTLHLPYSVQQAEFSPKMDQIVLATSAGGVFLWQPATSDPPRQVGQLGGNNPLGISFRSPGDGFVVTTDQGEIGWYSLVGAGKQIAVTRWLDDSSSWLTTAPDGRFVVTGDPETVLGLKTSDQIAWKPANQQPGFAPGLLDEILNPK